MLSCLSVRLSLRLSPVFFPNAVWGWASTGFSYRLRYTCLYIFVVIHHIVVANIHVYTKINIIKYWVFDWLITDLRCGWLITVDNSTVHLLNGQDVGWMSSWQGMVSVAGIAFAVVLVLMTITFLCYHRVSGSRRPRKTQVGQVLLRPRDSGTHDARSRRADGASASLWSDRTASPADSPTKSFLLTSTRTGTAPRHPLYYVDGPFPQNEILESNVDTLGRPCPAYRIYGFPAYYGSPQGEVVPGCYYDVPACVNCSQRRSQSPEIGCVGCTEHGASFPGGHGCGGPAEEVFIDGPPRNVPAERVGSGHRRSRPRTEGIDSETTPIKTIQRPNGALAWKSPDHEEEGTYVDLRETPAGKRPEVEEGKRPDHEEEPRRAVRPDGQSPDDSRTEPAAIKPSAAVSCSTLSDLDNSAADELEYDDFIPQLPGSYFQMDPHAYTLTWSQQPPNNQQRLAISKQPPQSPLSASEASLDARWTVLSPLTLLNIVVPPLTPMESKPLSTICI